MPLSSAFENLGACPLAHIRAFGFVADSPTIGLIDCSTHPPSPTAL